MAEQMDTDGEERTKKKSRTDDMGALSSQSSVLCWGSTDHGQLGLGGIEEEQILRPRELSLLASRQVKQIACGKQHTLFLMQDGSLYSCGNNDSGQLGHDKERRKPGHISALDTQVICQVACGIDHSVALTTSGGVFTWGDNKHGQLGMGEVQEGFRRTPKMVKGFHTKKISQVACGDRHTLAMADDGVLFSWGGNERGQLGLGHVSPYCDIPQQIVTLRGLAMSQLAAGGMHSMALTVSGALFSWGKNSSGQLGIGDTQDRCFPFLVKTLRSQQVRCIVCGEEHTAALTRDGGVFTFGAGQYGQLGHGSTNQELLPRKVFELMGSMITQVACGRRHTIVFGPSGNKISCFGLGANGQLGLGDTSRRVMPALVKEPFITEETVQASSPSQHCVHCLYAGGDQTFVYTTSAKSLMPAVDMRTVDPLINICTLTEDVLRPLRGLCEADSFKVPKDISEHIQKMFSSSACLNASFLQKDGEHCACSARHHGVDLDAARLTFNLLSEVANSTFENIVNNSLESMISTQLPKSPPDVESLRLYLTLPWCHLFTVQDNYKFISGPFARSLLRLDQPASKVIDRWWATLPKEHLTRILQIYRMCILHVLYLNPATSEAEATVRQQGLHLSLEMLKKLYNVNEQLGYLIPYDQFYISELKERVNMEMDYITWVQQRSTGQDGQLCFCNYPFVFDGPCKSILLQTDAMLQMRFAVDEVNRRNFTSLWVPNIDATNPCLVLIVTRNNIVQDTIGQLEKQKTHDFKKPLKVIFMGEEAFDAGGVKKEFFMLLLKEVLDPKYGMFKSYEDSRLLWFAESTFEDSHLFYLIGVLCGLAIYNSTIIHLQFPLALYKKLLKQPVTLEDLRELQPSVYRSFQELLQYDGDDIEDVFCLTFETTVQAFGETREVELKPGGAEIMVNKENRQEYVNTYLDYVFNKSVEIQFEGFYTGFHKVCGGKVLELFQPRELQAMVIGNENYDWETWEKNAQYKGEYHVNHPTMKFFWEVFRELSQEQKKKFLLFLTGSDRIPIHGMRSLRLIIQSVGGGEEYLPVAHTCFNLLDLPKYKSKQQLREKLLEAIEHTQGFGLV